MKKFISQIAIALVLAAMVGSVNAAVTTNDTAGGVGTAPNAIGKGKVYVVPFTYDATDTPTAAALDSVVVLHVRSNAYVRQIRYQVVATNADIATFNISDSRSATQFVVAAAGIVGAPAVTPVGQSEFYTANGTIAIHCTNVLNALIVKGAAEIVDLTP